MGHHILVLIAALILTNLLLHQLPLPITNGNVSVGQRPIVIKMSHVIYFHQFLQLQSTYTQLNSTLLYSSPFTNVIIWREKDLYIYYYITIITTITTTSFMFNSFDGAIIISILHSSMVSLYTFPTSSLGSFKALIMQHLVTANSAMYNTSFLPDGRPEVSCLLYHFNW